MKQYNSFFVKFTSSVAVKTVFFLLNASFFHGNPRFNTYILYHLLLCCQISETFYILRLSLIYHNRYWGRMPWDSHCLRFSSRLLVVVVVVVVVTAAAVVVETVVVVVIEAAAAVIVVVAAAAVAAVVVVVVKLVFLIFTTVRPVASNIFLAPHKFKSVHFQWLRSSRPYLQRKAVNG